MALSFTSKQVYEFKHHAVLAGHWYCNNQNTNEKPWGGIVDSADVGRFVYEYVLHRNFSRGMGVWGQAMAVMNLMDMGKSFPSETSRFEPAAKLGANYLKCLQVMDFRLPKSIGAFREHTPMTEESYPRDGVTGAFGLCRLFQETKDEEWLMRAKLFADWWIQHGTDANGWPYITFNIDKQIGHNFGMHVVGESEGQEYTKGDWQAGAAIFFFQLYKLTGDAKYIEQAFDPLINGLAAIYEKHANDPVVDGFHGEVPISFGNDDFALVSLVCAYRLTRELRLLNLLKHRIAAQNALMADDGSYPSFGGTFVCGINNLEYLRLVAEEKLAIDVTDVEACVRRTAMHGLTVQEKVSPDLRLLGGLYGQSNYDVGRTWIHQRSIGYSINFYLRLIGATPASFSSFGW